MTFRTASRSRNTEVKSAPDGITGSPISALIAARRGNH
jgi:hypothetical protein